MKNNKKLTELEELSIIKTYLKPNSLFYTAKLYCRNRLTIKKILKKYNIKLHTKEIQNKCMLDEMKKTKKARYNNEYYSNQEKAKNTKKIKYGDEYYTNRKKAEETCLNKFGSKSVFASDFGKSKIKQTKKLKYNNEFYSNRQKAAITCTERYGCSSYSKTDTFKNILNNKKLQSNIKRENTCLNKYKVKNSFQSKEVKEKAIKTNLKKYGVKYYSQTIEYLDKQLITKKKNKTFNTSKPEEDYYKLLCNEYGKANVIKQYKEARYPFACDFYIKSLDLFIELNLHWTHGGKLFDGAIEDMKKLAIWKEKAKTSKFYQNAIYTWTKRDVIKQTTAKQNKLNYITIFSKSNLKILPEKLYE